MWEQQKQQILGMPPGAYLAFCCIGYFLGLVALVATIYTIIVLGYTSYEHVSFISGIVQSFNCIWLPLVLIICTSYSLAEYRYEKKLRLGLLNKPPFWCRTSLPIQGHAQFRASVEQVLQELREHVPHRYREVIEYLPRAVYNPSSSYDGLSDGSFSLDGSGISRSVGGGRYTRNDYERFRFVFLHEVGHNVHGELYNDWSQDAANAYAQQVIAELG